VSGTDEEEDNIDYGARLFLNFARDFIAKWKPSLPPMFLEVHDGHLKRRP